MGGEPERRATFIVRLARAGEAAWHGVVELAGDGRRSHVVGIGELGDFIEGVFTELAAGRRKERPGR